LSSIIYRRPVFGFPVFSPKDILLYQFRQAALPHFSQPELGQRFADPQGNSRRGQPDGPQSTTVADFRKVASLRSVQ
jgi:hypothetical protein